MAKGDQPRRHSLSGGTICSTTNGPGGPAVAAINGPGNQFWGDQFWGDRLYAGSSSSHGNGLTLSVHELFIKYTC